MNLLELLQIGVLRLGLVGAQPLPNLIRKKSIETIAALDDRQPRLVEAVELAVAEPVAIAPLLHWLETLCLNGLNVS